MTSIETIGLLAGICTTTAFFPQAYKVYKTRDTKSISLVMFSVFITGIIFWIIYGILINHYPVVIPNIITFFLAGYILLMKIKYG